MSSNELHEFANAMAIDFGMPLPNAILLVGRYAAQLDTIVFADADKAMKRLLLDGNMPRDPAARLAAIVKATLPKSSAYRPYEEATLSDAQFQELDLLRKSRPAWDKLPDEEKEDWITIQTDFPKEEHRTFRLRSGRLAFARRLQKIGQIA